MNTEKYTKSLIDTVEEAGGDVKLNKRKLDIAEKEVMKKAKRGRVKPSFKKGGIGIVKKRKKYYNTGGVTKGKGAQYRSYEDAAKAREAHISCCKNQSWTGTFWTEDADGKKVVSEMSFHPRGSEHAEETQSAMLKAKKEAEMEERRKEMGYQKGGVTIKRKSR